MNQHHPALPARKSPYARLVKRLAQSWELYLFLLPAVVAVFLFAYRPMFGVKLAFMDLFPGRPLSSAKWVGLQNFQRFFANRWAIPVIRNTIVLCVATKIIEWPFPILLAVLLFNAPGRRLQKTAQMMAYIPHLVSVVVVVSILQVFLALDNGLVNALLARLGLAPVYFFGMESAVLPIYLVSEMWQHVGYSAVIYLAAFSAMDREMLEAARVDGATKLQRIWFVDLPSIAPTIIVLLILRIGSIFQMGPDKMLLLQTQLNIGASEVLSTYAYKIGIQQLQLGFSAAIGLLNNSVNLVLLTVANFVSHRITSGGIF